MTMTSARNQVGSRVIYDYARRTGFSSHCARNVGILTPQGFRRRRSISNLVKVGKAQEENQKFCERGIRRGKTQALQSSAARKVEQWQWGTRGKKGVSRYDRTNKKRGNKKTDMEKIFGKRRETHGHFERTWRRRYRVPVH